MRGAVQMVAAIAAGVVLFGLDAASAARTRSFGIEGWESFRKAERSGVSLSRDGSLSPGPAIRPIAGSAGSQVWSLAVDRAGVVFAATGSEGIVYRIGADGGIDSIQTAEMEVFAAAAGPAGEIYVGGAPNGSILRIARSGEAETFFELPERIIWDLEVGPDGTVYAATGDQGALYRITPAGKGSVLYRAEDAHLLSLAWTPAGDLLAGTAGRGLLLRIDPTSGAAEVLYDSPYSEIPEIAVAGDGLVYFAAVAASDDGIEPLRGQEQPVGEAPPPEGHGKEEGPARVYLRDREGAVRLFWEATESTIQALEARPGGDLWVGTGEEAALYRIDASGEATLVWSPDEREILDLLGDGDRILAATGNPGRVYSIGPGPAPEPSIRIEPADAGIRSRWGRASWEVLPGSGSWILRTRSGETEEPDASWSSWSEPLDDPEGSAIGSPPARHLQCEARYTGSPGLSPARLQRIWIPYREPNLPPQLGPLLLSSDDQEAEGAGGGGPATHTQELGGGIRVQFQSSGGGSANDGRSSAPPWVRAVRSIAWKASDPNGDLLRFDVGIRRVGEERFRTVAEDLEQNAYAIDTRSLPEGSYEVRVRATDATSNPPGEALTAERIGGPFRVDHTGPAIRGLVARRPAPGRLLVEGEAEDALTPIRALEISLDGGDWRPVVPVDGFLDGRSERFRVEIDLRKPEEGRWLAVRAVDAAGNVGIARLWLED